MEPQNSNSELKLLTPDWPEGAGSLSLEPPLPGRPSQLPTPTLNSNSKLKLTKGVITPDSNGIFREVSQKQMRWLRQLVKQGGPSPAQYTHPWPLHGPR
jgi:hypothetical protein